jgi:thiamine biosynthesis lipoprotein
MSTYQDNSDISRINSGAEEVEVDVHFQNVFRYSNQIFRESNGYFDPTVGSLVNAYGFGPDKPLDEPDEAVLDSIKQLVGFEKVKLTAGNTIQKENPNIYLDFNAIAKGYTIDVIADYLDKQNVENYLIELGGELVAKGQNLERESPWMVAIDNPQQTDAERTLQTVLALKNRAMATSGNYRKFRIDSITGNRYVHTINPLNGKAEKSNLLSASVLAENCTLADGYATAFMALGYEKSLEMLEELENVDVYFIYVDEAESIRVFTSNGFAEALVED